MTKEKLDFCIEKKAALKEEIEKRPSLMTANLQADWEEIENLSAHYRFEPEDVHAFYEKILAFEKAFYKPSLKTTIIGEITYVNHI